MSFVITKVFNAAYQRLVFGSKFLNLGMGGIPSCGWLRLSSVVLLLFSDLLRLLSE